LPFLGSTTARVERRPARTAGCFRCRGAILTSSFFPFPFFPPSALLDNSAGNSMKHPKLVHIRPPSHLPPLFFFLFFPPPPFLSNPPFGYSMTRQELARQPGFSLPFPPLFFFSPTGFDACEGDLRRTLQDKNSRRFFDGLRRSSPFPSFLSPSEPDNLTSCYRKRAAISAASVSRPLLPLSFFFILFRWTREQLVTKSFLKWTRGLRSDLFLFFFIS